MPTRATRVVLAPPLLYLLFIALAGALSLALPVSLVTRPGAAHRPRGPLLLAAPPSHKRPRAAQP